MKEITIGQFYPINSFIHSLDPRTKILGTILIIAFTFVSNTFAGLFISALFILLIALIGKIPLKKLFASLKAIYFILIFTFLLNAFFIKDGKEIFSFGIITLTVGGIIRAVYMALRLMLLIVSAGLLTLTTSPIQLTDGLERLFAPLKVIGFPAHEIAMMMTIALRFIPTLLEETDKIIKAQTARGADFESGNLINRAKAMIPILIPLFISAFRRADELAVAMECRCYQGGEGRTKLKNLKFHKIDLYSFLFILVFCVAVLSLNFI